MMNLSVSYSPVSKRVLSLPCTDTVCPLLAGTHARDYSVNVKAKVIVMVKVMG